MTNAENAALLLELAKARSTANLLKEVSSALLGALEEVLRDHRDRDKWVRFVCEAGDVLSKQK